MELNIQFLENEKCLLKEGQKADFETPFLEKNTVNKIKIPVSKKLEVNPANIFRYLKKLVGENIKKGDLLAEKKGFFGNKRIVADSDGIVKEIDHINGQIVVDVFTENKKTANSYFIGKVKKISNQTITVDVGKGETFELKNSSNSFGGQVFYFHDQTNISSANIDGKIVIAESINSFSQTKLEALGASGIVTLLKLEEESEIAQAQIKNINDMKKILKLKLPNCCINKKEEKIYFY